MKKNKGVQVLKQVYQSGDLIGSVGGPVPVFGVLCGGMSVTSQTHLLDEEEETDEADGGDQQVAERGLNRHHHRLLGLVLLSDFGSESKLFVTCEGRDGEGEGVVAAVQGEGRWIRHQRNAAGIS